MFRPRDYKKMPSLVRRNMTSSLLCSMMHRCADLPREPPVPPNDTQ